MPITGPTSYITTVPLFLNHWEDANEIDELIVLDAVACGQTADVDRARLSGLFTTLTAQRDALEAVLLEINLGYGTLQQEKAVLQTAVIKFNRKVRSDHGGTTYERALEVAPNVSDGRDKFQGPLRRTRLLWTTLNAWRAAQTTPRPALILEGGMTLAQFSTAFDALVAQWNLVEEREQEAALQRGRRNDAQDEIYPVLRVYRLKIQATFPAGSAIVETLPALTDTATGTPEPGALSGQWVAASTNASLTGTASTSSTVVCHQIRASVTEDPSVEDESVVAEFALGTPLTLSTTYGLTVSGAKAHFRLVGITADGHESGSEWVTIERPV